MDSFMTWIGGKRCLRDEILLRFPLEYERYIEVFGGAAWILFHKKKDAFEVYNDFNSNLTCLFNVVRNHPLELIKELGYYPINGREEFETIKRHLTKKDFDYRIIEKEAEIAKEIMSPEYAEEIIKILYEEAEKEDIKRAANFYKLIRFSYGAGLKSPACQPANIRATFPMIQNASRRLESVVIENKSFEALIKQYDRDNAFFYCDPPYYMTEHHYSVGFPKENHILLFNVLSQIKGKVLVSYNDCEFIKELYKDFFIEEIERTNTLALRYDSKAVFKEVLISNYDTKKRKSIETDQINLFNLIA